jgi:hypothetical protein
MQRNAEQYTNNFSLKMDEWDAVCSPGAILTIVHEILIKHGFKIALQYVRYLFRASGLLRTMLLRGQGSTDKIKGITQRYLDIDFIVEQFKKGTEDMDQDSLDKWLA